MKKSKSRISIFLCMVMILSACFGTISFAAEETHTVWVVGDSTVCAFDDNYYYPRYGYGTQLATYFDDTLKVENLAQSGRSSKSFLTEGNYQTLKNGIKAGDYLIIGFGHNDEKNELERYTNPNGDYQTEGSFANSIYTNYVKLAQDAGAEAIVCTPIVRRDATQTLSDSKCHITKDATDDAGNVYPGGDYPKALRDMCETLNIPIIDLTKLTKELYESIGPGETLYMHSWNSNNEKSVDDTHLNIYGAKKVAYLFANAVKKTSFKLASHIVDRVEPTRAADLVSNPNYVPPVYDSNLAQSEYFADYGAFKGTVFGTIGGQTKVTDNKLYKDEDGAMRIVAGGGSKIASTADGFGMYYYKVPATSQFSLKATAKINSLNTDNQAAFGLMARDDMYIDKHDTGILSDYVAAGSLGDGKNCFNRRSAKLNKSEGLKVETLVQGGTYELSIVSNSDGYACTFGKEETQTGGYDFKLTSIDSDYVYIGMFANRKMDVSFYNISLVVDGEEIDITKPAPIYTPKPTSSETPAPDASATPEPGTTTTPGASATPTPGTSETPEPSMAPTPAPTDDSELEPIVPEDKVEAFVQRFYTKLLKRNGEEAGIKSWTEKLKSNDLSAIFVGYFYVDGDEFKEQDLSNEEYLERLYETFMDRPSDEGGKAYWLERLNYGFTRNYVYLSFATLPEFTGICEEYGITRGEANKVGPLDVAGKEYRNQNLKVSQYIFRCYSTVLNRETPDDEGLEFWCQQIITKQQDAKNIAECFVLSPEFKSKDITDEQYIEVMYQTFFGRPGEDTGKTFWLGQLSSGEKTRDDVLHEFSTVPEFAEVLEGFEL